MSGSKIMPCQQLLSNGDRCGSQRVRLERYPRRRYVCRDCGATRKPEELKSGGTR